MAVMSKWGDGTVFWRADRERWMGEWTVKGGRGGRRRKTITLKAKTKPQAERELAKRRSTFDDHPSFDEHLRLDAFLERWLADVATTIKPRTLDYYRSVVETHLSRDLGGHRLVDLRAPHIAAYRNRKIAEGLAPRTVSHHLAVLRAALSQAERWDMVVRNEAKLVQGPRIPRRDVTTLRLFEVQTLLAGVKGDPMEAVYALAALTGMRQGEILGLRWGDIDGSRVTVRKTLVWLNGTVTLQDAKTDESHRTITVPSMVAEALTRRRAEQNADRLGNRRWSRAWTEGFELVFTDADGYAVERTVITRAMYRHLAAAGLPRVTFHALRHGYVGIMRELGMSTDDISGILGHASAVETRETYMHLDHDVSSRAAKMLDVAVG
jgi:integrase